HPSCPFGSRRYHAMVALVRDIKSNKPRGVHRTALSPEGRKLNHVGARGRLSLGRVGGGAIKITPDENVTLCLGIAEGIESALSLQHVPEFGGSPIWSLLSSGGIGSFEPLPGIESLWIHEEPGDAGNKAADAVSYRWRRASKETFRVSPTAGGDLNDQ